MIQTRQMLYRPIILQRGLTLETFRFVCLTFWPIFWKLNNSPALFRNIINMKFVFLSNDILGNNCKIDISLSILVLMIFSGFSSRNIYKACKTKGRAKSSLWSQTYSWWTKFILLSRIRAFEIRSRKFNGESSLFFNPVLTLWSGDHIVDNVWRRVIPSDLPQSFGTICAQNR